jgi:hypothetical protein
MLELNRHVEFNNYAQRRMREDFAAIHEIALRWGDEFRADGAPPDTTSIAGKMDRTHASTLGAPTPPAADDVTVFGVCVSKLPSLKQIVTQVEYAECRGWAKTDKIKHLLRKHKIRMSPTGWDRHLSGAREILSVTFNILFERPI